MKRMDEPTQHAGDDREEQTHQRFTELDACRVALSGARADLEMYSKQIEDQAEDLALVQEEVGVLRADITRRDEEIARLQNELTAATATLEDEEAGALESAALISRWKEKIAELEAENANLRSIYAEVAGRDPFEATERELAEQDAAGSEPHQGIQGADMTLSVEEAVAIVDDAEHEGTLFRFAVEVARTLRRALAEAQHREEIIAQALTDSENEAEKFRAARDRAWIDRWKASAEMGVQAEAERDAALAKLDKAMAALKTVRPYFEGEHHYDHPACVQLRAALDTEDPT